MKTYPFHTRTYAVLRKKFRPQMMIFCACAAATTERLFAPDGLFAPLYPTGRKFKFWVGLLDHATKKTGILGLKRGMGLLARWA